PFDPSMKAENFRSCWFYRNEGSNENPVFTFKKDRFFQDGMIDLGSAAHPLFADVDGDGLTDLLAGNYGYYDSSWYENGILHSSFISKIAWFRNTGDSAHPEFSLITDDFASLSQLKATGLFPAFGDLDGDARPDLIAGREDGTVIFLKNNSLPEGPPSFERPVLNFKNIDVGEYSAPQPFDLDKDGLQDLIIGEKAGNLNYYRNTGSSGNPAFTLVTDSLGKINVTNYALSYDGYSTPCFFRFPDGTTGLLAGAEEGKIHFYSGIDGHLGDPFGESDTLGRIINGESIELTRGMQSSPAIANLSGGNYFDLVYGNFSGGMNYCSYGAAPKVITGVAGHSSSSSAFYTISPNPADQFVNIRATTAGRYTVSFIDLQGRQVQFCQLTGNQSISVSGLSAGLYVLILSPLSSQTDIKPLIYKVLIQH
ncbi:MAG: T9SS type A sorting domain-containing protein, partial [Syntrophothermus sp.]